MPAFRLVDWQCSPRLVEVPVPEPGAGEVLIRVAGNGLCHSDVTMAEVPREIGEALGWEMPFTLGHEAAGWVAALGEGVTSVGIGDAVALMSSNSCGDCRFCAAGRDSLCESNMVGRGYGRDGGLASYVVASIDRDVVPLGSLDPTTAGTLTDAGATSYHAVSRVLGRLPRFGNEHPKVAVFGIGGLGTFTVQILVAAGDVEVIAVDPDPAKRARASELGAIHTLDGVDSGTRSQLRAIAGPAGVAGIIDIVGTDETIECGIRSLARAGVFALVGAAGGRLNKPWFSTFPHEAEIFTFQGSSRSDVEAMVELAASGHISVDAELFALSAAADAYEKLQQGALRGRAVVIPD